MVPFYKLLYFIFFEKNDLRLHDLSLLPLGFYYNSCLISRFRGEPIADYSIHLIVALPIK